MSIKTENREQRTEDGSATPQLPATYYVGRGQLISWLEEWGMTAREVRSLIDSDTIPKHHISGFRRKVKYVPQEVANILGLGK